MQVQWFASCVQRTTNEILTCVYIGRADLMVRSLFVLVESVSSLGTSKLQILLTHFAAFKFDLFLIHKMLKGSINEISR